MSESINFIPSDAVELSEGVFLSQGYVILREEAYRKLTQHHRDPAIAALRRSEAGRRNFEKGREANRKRYEELHTAILIGVLKEMSEKRIASFLGITIQTVSRHLSSCTKEEVLSLKGVSDARKALFIESGCNYRAYRAALDARPIIREDAPQEDLDAPATLEDLMMFA